MRQPCCGKTELQSMCRHDLRGAERLERERLLRHRRHIAGLHVFPWAGMRIVQHLRLAETPSRLAPGVVVLVRLHVEADLGCVRDPGLGLRNVPRTIGGHRRTPLAPLLHVELGQQSGLLHLAGQHADAKEVGDDLDLVFAAAKGGRDIQLIITEVLCPRPAGTVGNPSTVHIEPVVTVGRDPQHAAVERTQLETFSRDHRLIVRRPLLLLLPNPLRFKSHACL